MAGCGLPPFAVHVGFQFQGNRLLAPHYSICSFYATKIPPRWGFLLI
jgi:hypothetical protein